MDDLFWYQLSERGQRIVLAAGASLWALILAGPPAWAAWKLLNGAELFAISEKTVTYTTVDGVAVHLTIWLAALTVLAFHLRGETVA